MWKALKLACCCHCACAVRMACALWSWAGMLVPLQDAAAGCCCRIFLKATGRVSPLRVVAKKKICWQNTSSDLANVPSLRVGTFEVWIGYDLEYDSETHLSLEFRKQSTQSDCYILYGCSGSTCQRTLDRTWKPGRWHVFWTTSDVPLAQLRLGYSQPASHSLRHPAHQKN